VYPDPVDRFKWSMLGASALDPPWSTGMARLDAVGYLEGFTSEQLDEAVLATLAELLDEGFIFFFREAGLGGQIFDHPVDEADGMPREEVVAELAKGSNVIDEYRISLNGEGLYFEATKKGIERYRSLPHEYYNLNPGTVADWASIADRLGASS
jgi:hypothetical protein